MRPSPIALLSKWRENRMADPSPPEKVARQSRMREARTTISPICIIVERVPLTRRYRATLSRLKKPSCLLPGEKDTPPTLFAI